MKKPGRGFTLVELMVVISIIALLSSILILSYHDAFEKAKYARDKAEFRSIVNTLELYKLVNNGQYPAETDRTMPAGLAQYLNGGIWPKGPWAGSEYDWDNYLVSGNGNNGNGNGNNCNGNGNNGNGNGSGNACTQVYQISIRFCPENGPASQCNFPNQSWANNFGQFSSLYYCISGLCQAHMNRPASYAGYCINCITQPN